MRRLSPPASTSSVACITTIIGPAVRAIDFHVHLPTPEWLDVSMKGYVEAAEAYFRSKVVRRSLEELARDYEKLDVLALLLAWDAETATAGPACPTSWSPRRAGPSRKRSPDSAASIPLKGRSAPSMSCSTSALSA
jgi:hypothetical protein